MLCSELTGIVSAVNSRFNAIDGKLSRARSQVILKKLNFIFSCIISIEGLIEEALRESCSGQYLLLVESIPLEHVHLNPAK